METDKDHIHILLGYYPDVSIAEIVKNLKQYSTYKMWKYHKAYLSKMYWKGKALWSDGYFACSIGQVSQAIYIGRICRKEEYRITIEFYLYRKTYIIKLA